MMKSVGVFMCNINVPDIACLRLQRLKRAKPNSLVDLWTVQSANAISSLRANAILIGNTCAVYGWHNRYKRRAYCWMRREMRWRIPPARQYPNWRWPIWAWATKPKSIDRAGDQTLHIRLPRDSILFSWHFLWERLLHNIMTVDNLGIQKYFAWDQDDQNHVCPSGKVPPCAVCRESWPRMFCLNMLQSSLYKDVPDKVVQATITHIPITAVVDWR